MKKDKNSLIRSFNNAIEGIIFSVCSERNMRIHVIMTIIVMSLSLYYRISRSEFLIICVIVAMVISCELINTAIEVVVDTFTEKYHEKAKYAKDMAAGAVLVSTVAALAAGYFVFYDRITSDMEIGIKSFQNLPGHFIVVVLAVTTCLVIFIKAKTRKGTFMRGGMPSGHTAVAFSITTIMALWSGNIIYTVLCLSIAILLIQSRVESGIHSLIETLAGALLGIAVTLAVYSVLI